MPLWIPLISTGCFVFIIIYTSCGDRASQRLFCEITIWSCLKFFSSEKKTKHVRLARMLEFVEKLSSVVFPFAYRGLWWKSAISFLVWEIPNVFMHYLPDKKLRHSHVPDYGSDGLAGIVLNYLTTKFRSFFLIRTIRAVMPSQPPLNSSNSFRFICNVLKLTPKHSEICALLFSVWMLSSTACKFQISGAVNCVMQLPSSDRHCQTDSNLLHSRQSLKQSRHMREINYSKWQQFIHRHFLYP